MVTKARQREETTRVLLETARELFAGKGYANVSLAEISLRAGVTKGALYHYFSGKDDLFRAVLAQVHAEVAARVEAVPPGDPWTQLMSGCRTFLEAAIEPRFQRIMLIDAPAVLGWEAWRLLDAESSVRHLADALRLLIDAGVLAERPVEPLVHLLSGAMNDAAIWLAGSADPERDLEDTVSALTAMVGALRC